METNVLIIGGGLTGLRLATLLADRGEDFRLVEARDRLGGRILSEGHASARYDLGPAWYWPGQPRMQSLIERLQLKRIEQYAKGDLLYEDETGTVLRKSGYAPMQRSFRLEGGFGGLVDKLAATLPSGRLHLDCPVQQIRNTPYGLEAIGKSGQTFKAKKIVVATPPRVAATIEFAPALPEPTVAAMQRIATWMAGQAKIVALYDRPFWRNAGLSGSAISRRGPLVEIHDASPKQGGPSALFGFVGVPPASRLDESALRQAAASQLERIFGLEATSPRHLFLKDWASDPRTSTPLDHRPLYEHPRYGPSAAFQGLWQNQLVFAATELAPTFGGYLEGALEAAEETVRALYLETV